MNMKVFFADGNSTGSGHATGGGFSLARAFCVFLAVFWTIRPFAATFVFDVWPYLTNRFWRLVYHATNIVFVYLPVVYAWTALKGGIQ